MDVWGIPAAPACRQAGAAVTLYAYTHTKNPSGGTRNGIRIDINFRWRTDRPALQKLEESFLYLKW